MTGAAAELTKLPNSLDYCLDMSQAALQGLPPASQVCVGALLVNAFLSAVERRASKWRPTAD